MKYTKHQVIDVLSRAGTKAAAVEATKTAIEKTIEATMEELLKRGHIDAKVDVDITINRNERSVMVTLKGALP